MFIQQAEAAAEATKGDSHFPQWGLFHPESVTCLPFSRQLGLFAGGRVRSLPLFPDQRPWVDLDQVVTNCFSFNQDRSHDQRRCYLSWGDKKKLLDNKRNKPVFLCMVLVFLPQN